MPTRSSIIHSIRFLIAMLALALVIFLVVFCLPLFLMFYDPDACLTETHKTITDLAGLDFTIRETACAGLGSSDRIDVSVARTGRGGKTLLFQYDPGGYPGPLPVISRPDPRTIHIAIPRVSEILLRQDTWQGMSVTYDIGHVTYPDPEPAKK